MASLIPYRYRAMSARPESGLFGEDFFKPFFWNMDQLNGAFRVDVRDMGDHYLLEADLPGLTREQVHIDVEDGLLTISTEVCENCEDKQEKTEYIFNERRYGRMQRSFSLNQIKEDEIRAEYKDGVLKLILPKQGQEPKRSHHVEIE